jgi:NADP-dependent 3-hydroxy acid dehydrogenase YdfG
MAKVCLITGSSGSLGRTIAEAALAGGDRVLATAREPARLQDLVHSYGSRIRTVQHDIRNASEAATAAQIAVYRTVFTRRSTRIRYQILFGSGSTPSRTRQEQGKNNA